MDAREVARYRVAAIVPEAFDISRKVTAALLAVALVAAVAAGMHYWKRTTVAADVTLYVPVDADAVLYIPRVDTFTEEVLTFTRGIQEAAFLRELLKSETGVELSDAEGLRRVGIDPEAGLVVFGAKGMAHVLLGVESAETMLEALQAKFANMGRPHAQASAPDANGVVSYVVPGESGAFAAFGAHDGLLAIVYRGLGQDPDQALRAVLSGPASKAFFGSERHRAIEKDLGSEGALAYAAGDATRGPDGEVDLSGLQALGLPPVALGVLQPQLAGWLKSLEWMAARLTVSSCDAQIQSAVRAADGQAPLPPAWVATGPGETSPAFGKLLPRDAVLMVGLGLELAPLKQTIESVARLSQVSDLGSLFGMGEKKPDPVASLLGRTVHPKLDDRHPIVDGLDHLTGRAAVILAGVHRKARAKDVLDIGNVQRWLGYVMQTAVAVELKDGDAFWSTWWAEREVLSDLGFEVERPGLEDDRALVLRRGCDRRGEARSGSKAPICEHYGVMLTDDILIVTTGPGTLERVREVVKGVASSLHGLTRERLAQTVLEGRFGTMGAYFSFDGLLKAVRNLNLPGGATRYLAQMYELALTVDNRPGDVRSHVLLTR